MSNLNEIDIHKPLILSPNDCKKILYRIEEIITDTCNECGYDQLNIKPTNWSYILHRISEDIFEPHPELFRKYNPTTNSYTKGEILLDNLDMIYDRIYKPLCDKYNQITGQYPFCKMLAVDSYNLLKQWDNYQRVTSNGISIREKIIRDRETSLRDAMLSSNQNPVKYLAIGNHEFAWNESKPEKIEEQKTVISLDDIPQLELSDNSQLPFFDDTE